MASKSSSKAGGSAGSGKGGNKSALAQPVTPDEHLAAVVGADPLPRTEVVKKLWDYIKAESLQDPKDKKMINSDDKLRAIFDGKKQVSMFEMTKLVSKHMQ